MNSMLDSLTWGEELSSQCSEKPTRKSWLRRALVVLTALFVLGVLLS